MTPVRHCLSVPNSATNFERAGAIALSIQFLRIQLAVQEHGSLVKLSFWGCLLISLPLAYLCQSVSASEAVLDLEAREFQNINGMYEPSGIVQLQDARLLVIEDEPSRAFVLLTPRKQSNTLNVELLRSRSPIAALLAGPSGQFNDLEGLVKGPQDVIYAITSHSRQGNGGRDPDREKLVRLTIDGNRIGKISVRTDLRERLIDAYPELEDDARERDVKDDAGLNIEGLTFNRRRDTLWIGFRAPLVDEKAILIALGNPQTVFDTDEDYQFDENLQLLDLDGGGIRDIVFDPVLDGYLIVSQREGTKKEKAFKLWFWAGSSAEKPRRVGIPGVKDLQRTEGIAPVTLSGINRLLLVSDEGDASNQKGAEVLVVDYDDQEFE